MNLLMFDAPGNLLTKECVAFLKWLSVMKLTRNTPKEVFRYSFKNPQFQGIIRVINYITISY